MPSLEPALTRNPASAAKVPVSVLVLTRNEAANIEQCLRSVDWADEAFVVDSLSHDQTSQIAMSCGARVFVRPFEGYAAQRNWALENLPFSNGWVLMLDADELVPAALAAEIAQVLENDGGGSSGFYLNRRLVFLGRWLKHGGIYPAWILRLFKRQCGRFEERPLNEHAILNGAAGFLGNPFDHRDNHPLSEWIEKHNGYSDREAEEYLQEKFHGGYAASISPRLRGSQAEQKRWLKLSVWNRLPLLVRPFLLFFLNYILKAGFLDGRQGFIYHVLWSFWVRFLIDAKICERQARAAAAVPSGNVPRALPRRRSRSLPQEPGKKGMHGRV